MKPRRSRDKPRRHRQARRKRNSTSRSVSRERSRSISVSSVNSNRRNSRKRTLTPPLYRHKSRRDASYRLNSRDRSRLRSNTDLQLRSQDRQTSESHSRRSILDNTLDTILTRLDAIENNSIGVSSKGRTVSGVPERTPTQIITDALQSIIPSRSQNYYISNFDPSIHDIDTWCEEVDRAQLANQWGDCECLSRVANCLKGDAKTWLNEWVTCDRTWSSFKREFKPLCSKNLDYARILFETMCTNSDKFLSYSEYARRTILRLRIVKGLSEELMTLIVIRGINDAHIRAAAANANLSPDTIVPFLSIYQKPKHDKVHTKGQNQPLNGKTRFTESHIRNKRQIKCFTCNQTGHKSFSCPKNTNSNMPVNESFDANKTCTFCKKSGHLENSCFAKARSQPQKRNVNLCKDYNLDRNRNRDITTAVVQGIPIDVLIDSGALGVSLISSDVLKYFSHCLKPIKCTLKGLSDHEISASSYVTLTIEFSDISIEADLVVVPAPCISTSIIVGTDVLNREGITYVRTRDRQYITHTPTLVANVNTVGDSNLQEIRTPLEGMERNRLLEVINDFSKYFISGTATTTVTTGEMHINLTSDVPIVYRPYKLSLTEKLKVRDIIDDLLSKGIIRESESEYSSPIILVKKKDGSDRMCVDYRALNRITVKDRYPLPLIDDHIDRLGDKRVKRFSSLDMATGFHQIRVSESSIPKTAFVTPDGHYEYVKMPYGLCNSPIVYQRLINKTLRKHIDAGNVLVYIDDVLLMSRTVSEGIELLRDVLKTLTTAGFSINLRKCVFLTTEIEYLGRVISEGHVKPSPTKVKALVDSPVPQNVKQVRQFLGLAGYFRRYIKGFATITRCISMLTKQGVAFRWGPEQEAVRQEIITRLTTEPILAIFDPSLPTEVHTDASSIGYGAVLMQTHENSSKKVVSYFSKVTQGAESRYHSYELETLAVVRALQNFRHYLIGIKFKILTDCNALKATERKKDLLPRVARWWVYLQDFNFEIEYRKGSMMSHADYLSRNPPFEVNTITRPRNWAQIAQKADDETRQLVQRLNDGSLDSDRYIFRNDILYYKYKPLGEESRLLCFIPKGHRLSLLRVFHDEHNHIDFDKTLDLILKHFWFPGLRPFVKKYISHCLVCISKKRVPRAPLQNITSWQKPEIPFSTVHLDTLGPLPESHGYKFVLLIVDAFSKFVLLYPMYRQDVGELLKTVTNSISLFGVPKLFVTDKGRMFESSDFTKFLNDMGSTIHYITPEMHHANGQVERYARTVLNMLRIEVNHKSAAWSETLWKLQLTLNITKHKTTQMSALNLLIGTEATTPIIRSLVRDVAIESSTNREGQRELHRQRASELLERNKAAQDTYVNRHRRPPKAYNVDDLVFVIKCSQATGKLDPGMRGPYRVVRTLPGGRYELRLLSGAFGKTTQAAAQHMVPWRGEWCPETCAAFFECE